MSVLISLLRDEVVKVFSYKLNDTNAHVRLPYCSYKTNLRHYQCWDKFEDHTTTIHLDEMIKDKYIFDEKKTKINYTCIHTVMFNFLRVYLRILLMISILFKHSLYV